jgi:hypothetical protein
MNKVVHYQVERWEEERDGNHSPPKNNFIQDSKEMKKMDTHFQTPTKQRQTTPRNPMMPTRPTLKKKSYK